MKRTILVVGSTGLVGRNVTHGLLADGYEVVGVAKSGLDDATSLFDSKNYFHCSTDMVDELATEMICSRLGELGKKLDGLVYACRDRALLQGLKSSTNDWIEEYRLAVVAPYSLATGLLVKHPITSIVILNSIYGMVAQRPGLYGDPKSSLNPHYGCSKAASLQLVRELAIQLAPSCKVNSLVLGGIDHNVDPGVKAKYLENSPESKMLNPMSIYGPVKFLLGPDSIGLTGSAVVQDGGWTAW